MSKADIFHALNAPQLEAVKHLNGPLLVLAGAGTGKTRVLTTRIANILLSRLAFPSQILSVTFTNKAAKEMSERVVKLLESQGIRMTEGLWLGTFHSTFMRILRRHAELLGFQTNFTIIDDDDSLRLLKGLILENNIDEKRFPAKLLGSLIKRLKDKGITPDKVKSDDGDFAGGKLINLYEIYQSRLKILNAMDFGDLLLNAITLFTKHPDVLAEYQRKFKYILVDEYQDTNIAQYILLRLLAESHKNICCVGDDDQSIYSWRGAEVANILKFEKDFPGAKVVRLEQNYRSTKPILAVAAKVIANNKDRLGKTLWTDVDAENKVKVISVWDEKKEAGFVGETIEDIQRKGSLLKEFAVLVRAGFQTRAFEECFISMAIPYRVVGGLRFYERQEIRDAIAYLRVVNQQADDLAFERIINTPKRGLGASTIDQIKQVGREQNISMVETVRRMLSSGVFKPKAKAPLENLITLFDKWKIYLKELPPKIALEKILDESGYKQMWKMENTIEAQGRLENLIELSSAVSEFETMQEFLEHVSLVMDTDKITNNDMVNIMTLHSAKGLEFDTVFLTGWEEGLFPHQKSLDEKGTSGLEEERRLAYVGITRARKNLFISFAASRRIYNQWQSSTPSRFIDELPQEHIEIVNNGLEYYKEPNLKPTSNFFANNSFSKAKVFSKNETAGFVFDENKFKEKEVFLKTEEYKFPVGTRIFHEKFGYGFVNKVDGSHLTINFEKAGTKMLIDNFVKKA